MTRFFFPYPKGRASSLGILITIERIIFYAPSSFLCSASSCVYLIWTADPGRSSQVSVSHDRLKHSHKSHCQLRIRTNSWSRSQRLVSQPYYTENFNLSSAFLHITDIQKGSIGRNQTYKSLPAFTGETSKAHSPTYGRREVCLMAVYNWH